jgi:hypothetical protein
LYYQTASKEYIDFLRDNGGIDGLSLSQLWEKSKSPPQIVAQAWYPSYDVYLPLIEKSNQFTADTWMSSAIAQVISKFSLLACASSIAGFGLFRLFRRDV